MKNREKVMLIIEDDAETIQLFRLMFRRSKVKIVVKTSGEECMEVVQKLKPDVVLLDIMLPGIDGWKLYNRIRESPENEFVSIIVVSGQPKHISRLHGQIFESVEDYITKPFSPRSLVSLVERCLSLPSPPPLPGDQMTALN